VSAEHESELALEAHIEFRLAGEGIAPGTVRSRDLAEIIASAEDMIASVVVRDHPTITKDEVIVGLFSISEGSVALRFKTPLGQPVRSAFAGIARAIKAQDYEDLPDSARKSLGKIASFSRRRNCDLELYSLDGQRQRLAVVTPQTRVEPLPQISEFATIYGEVVRVGGVEPKVVIRLPNNQSISCDIDIDLARQLGPMLYRWVGVRGTGRWSAKHLSLEEFRVREITPYRDTPVSEAVAALAEILGPYYADIEDADSYVAGLRAERAEE
jgi:hypothetical protein